MAITALTLRVRKNGADGNGIIQLASNQTGQFEDVTNSDTFVATDEINYSAVTGGSSGALVINHIGVLITNTEVIKTINGLVKSSCKTFNSLAIASVKSINGLT